MENVAQENEKAISRAIEIAGQKFGRIFTDWLLLP